MSAADVRLRLCLQWVWRRTLIRLAALDIAAPKLMPITERGQYLPRYLWAAVCAAAPLSTACMVVATLVGTICNIGQSFLLGRITDSALMGQRGQVSWLLIGLMMLWLAAPLTQALHSLARLYANQNLRIAVTDHLVARLMYARLQPLASNAVGNLVDRVEVTSTSLPAVVCIISDTIVKLLSVAILASMVLGEVSTPIALAAGAWMLTALLLSSYLAFTGMNIVEDASDAHAKVIADLAEIVSNVPLIQSFTAQAVERQRFGAVLQADLYACRRVRSYWVFVLLIEATYKWFFGLAITMFAVQNYASGAITLPQLITMCSLVIALSWHFESVAFHFVELFEALGTVRAGLRELSAIDVDLSKGSQPLPQPGSVKLKSVTASYGCDEVLRDVSLHITPGSKIGIVGPSGCGKSTLLAVLRGDLIPDGGHVELHGLPSSELSSEMRARTSSEAVQSALMFNRSVGENVAYGSITPTPQSIALALAAAQAGQLVDCLPQQLGTLVGERGASLSTGERQRLSIARALLKQAPLLVFDEATSSVDTISEALIMDHLVRNTPGRTAVVDDYDAHREEALLVLSARCGHGGWCYVELAPGDLILIPSGWWHEVINEGPTVGLTRNFVTPDIQQRVAWAAREHGLTTLRCWLDDSKPLVSI